MDTYKVATTANSCSTMHTITKKPITIDMISCDHLNEDNTQTMNMIMHIIEHLRQAYFAESDPAVKKDIWYNIIQMLPSSWNQMRTVTMNYETLYGIIKYRKNHKLDEWHTFCEDAIENCPYLKELVVDIIEDEDKREKDTDHKLVEELNSKAKYLEKIVKVYHAKYGVLTQEMIDEVLNNTKVEEESNTEEEKTAKPMETVVAVEPISMKRKIELKDEITEKLSAQEAAIGAEQASSDNA